ncbi:MAG TPA: glycosyltransferase family 87 protein [Candidatus Acidoferrales bacterium]|nr:glycosyltransferase family 87 protein [Candidatus Acidoferrales bacterium]
MTLRLAIYQFVVPYQLNYEEGNILNAAVRIVQGANPYPAIQPPIYVFNTYGPLVYYLIAPLVKHPSPVFTLPRVTICTTGLIVAALIVILLRRAGVSWKLSLSFALLYLTMPAVHDWVYLLRVDLVGIPLTLAGLGVCWILPRRWYLAVPLFVAAIYCKFTLIAAPAACCLHFAFRKEWRRTAGLAASIGGLSLVLFFVLERATQGWFAFNMFRTHPDPYLISQWAQLFFPALRVHAVLVFLALALAAEDVRRGHPSLPVIYFVLGTGMTLTAGKVGSDTNHLLEWLAALCLTAGLGYHALQQRGRRGWALALVPAALALVVLFTLPFDLDVEPARDGCREAYAYVKDHSGDHFLSENVGAIVLAGKPVTFSNPFVYAFLVKSGALSDDELAREIRERYYDAVLLDGDLDALKNQAADPKSPDTFWYADFLDALGQNYHPARQFKCIGARFAYEPNPPSAGAR